MPAPKSLSAIRFFFVTLLLLSHSVFSQSGKDGNKTITSANTVVNDYTILLADANAGATSLQVAGNALNAGFSSPLGAGDLVMIIQIQGADIVSGDIPTYGNIVNYQNCGNYEFCEVTSVFGAGFISISCPLQKSYSTFGKVEVVRVPRYNTLLVNSGQSISCPSWNGAFGGIVAVEVAGLTTVNGAIDATGKGFRGGGLYENNSIFGVLNYASSDNSYGGEKGESIAGSQNDYDFLSGRYCMGAPANGGGGGNGHNSGGGGGANGGIISSYTGLGNPDISNASWATAWNLESPGFASSTSSGGGRGGYSFSSENENPLVTGPNNPIWHGDFRRSNGGRGGKPLDYSTGKIFLGGGGGSGDQNDSHGGNGGSGGGLIFILSYNAVNGSGHLDANGSAGASTSSSNGTDGAGGGGGGGAVLISNSLPVVGITINANGGNGGSQSVQFFTVEAEGPGAGGGGGYIGINSGGVTRNVYGGANGTTNSLPFNGSFPPNGATKGGIGTPTAYFDAYRITTSTVNICSNATATLSFSQQGTVPPGIIYSWYNQSVGGVALATGATFTTPVLSASTTYYIGACPGNVRIPIQVNVGGNVSSAFSSNVVCAGTPTIFTATGSVNITGWSWDFGDGSPASSQQNPSHVYTTGGTYTAILTATDGSCSSSISHTVTVNTGPVVNFTSSVTGSCGPLNVQFNNSSTGASTYSWDFGDASTPSAQTNATHTYASAGTYTVVLTANGSGCSRTSSLTISVGPAPTSSFTASASACQNDTIHFTNNSTPNGTAITGYSWDFDDGSPASSAINPAHVFAGSGTFHVVLTAISAGCDDDTTITINISPAPTATFTATPSSGCNPLTVSFANTSGSANSNWNFGDGATSTSSTITHIYSTAGNYSVTLIASLGTCADTLQMNNLVHVSDAPHAVYSPSAASVCLGDAVSFMNASTGTSITGNSWNFGDGSAAVNTANAQHLYTTPGTFNATLTVSTAACNDDTTIIINVSQAPVADFSATTLSGCNPLNVQFANATSPLTGITWNWNFGDAGSSTLQTPSHTYTSSGSFPVTLIATLGTCSDTLTKTNFVSVSNAPIASFALSTPSVCLGDSISFSNLSSGNGSPLVSYDWNFGDLSVSSLASPSHLYAAAGIYSVHLTSHTAGCADDTIITITVNDLPQIAFAASGTNACDTLTVFFTNTTVGANSYSWNFGDGQTSTDVAPSHFFSLPGEYSVLLTATGTGACSTSILDFNLVTVNSTPVVDFTASQTSFCKDNCISFTPQITGAAATYNWTFDGATSPASTAVNPVNICYSVPGSYNVSLEVSDGGCSSATAKNSFIEVADCAQIPQAGFLSSDSSFCAGTCIDFVDLSSNATSWNWLFPGATTTASSLEDPKNICYQSPGVFDVTLISTNPAGSDTITLSNFVTVTNGPAAPLISQSGDTLTSSPADHYQWYYNNIPVSGATGQTYVATLSGPYSVSSIDVNGCMAFSATQNVNLIGIEEVEGNLSFYIFPNPADDKISILMNSIVSHFFKLKITDALGKIIFSDNYKMSGNQDLMNLDITTFAPGVYFITLNTEKNRWVRSFIKQ